MIRLLLVDDEERVVEGLQRRLQLHLNDFEIFTASGGQPGLEILAQSNIDIVISDLRMPQMDGAEFLKIVQERYPQVLRFILSGHADKELFLSASHFVHQHLKQAV